MKFDQLKKAFERISGFKIIRHVPLGLDPLEDIRRVLPHYSLNTLFDVGANIGQSATKYRKALPNARIHSVEPFSNTFNQLKANTSNLNLNYHNVALGSSSGTIEVKIDVENRGS